MILITLKLFNLWNKLSVHTDLKDHAYKLKISQWDFTEWLEDNI